MIKRVAEWDMRIFLFTVLLMLMNARAAADSAFFVQIDEARTLFDEADVDAYDSKTGIFELSPSASQRLVSNWQDFIKDPEDLPLKGTLVDADSRVFDVMIGGKKMIEGTVAIGPMTLHSVGPGAILLYGDIPLVVNQRVHVGIGKFSGDLKSYAESGPEKAFTPVLNGDVVEYLKQLNKSR